MKIRKPKQTGLKNLNLNTDNHYSITYKVETITPIYGGGIEVGVPDTEMPVRASAIRGQLRYWWRFLQSNRKDNKRLEGNELYEAERAIWGGIKPKKEDNGDRDREVVDSEENDNRDYDAAGKVTVNVIVREKDRPKNSVLIADENGSGVKYALFSAIQNNHKLLPEGVKFDLNLRALKKGDDKKSHEYNRGLTQEQWKQVFQAVQWWINFGGVGSRTRRGLGAVEVKGIEPLSAVDVEKYGCKLKRLNETSEAISAWDSAIKKLFDFRQGRGQGREQGQGNRPGRSYWPEPDTIRKLTGKYGHSVEHKAVGSFPRAMFGLPIIFEIRGNGEPPKTHLLPKQLNSNRMASPLIIKPVADGKRIYIPTALLLPSNHLVDLELKLKIDNANKEKSKLDKEVLNEFPMDFSRIGGDVWWPTNKEDQRKEADTIKPMKNRSCDPLQAFLDFFE